MSTAFLDPVRTALIEKEVPTVERIVNCLWRRRPIAGMEKGDLVSEGCIGLIKAADSYDETRGTEFRTHAVLCIRRALSNTLKRADVRNADALVAEVLQEENIAVPDFTAASDAKLSVETALPQLKPKRRQAVQLYFLDNLPQADVARQMHISQTHAKRLIDQGLANLRELLD